MQFVSHSSPINCFFCVCLLECNVHTLTLLFALTIARDTCTRDPPLGVFEIFDMYNMSCLNGWTMGNVATTGKNMAMFFRDVYSGLPSRQLLNSSTVRRMSVFRPLTNDWCQGCTYGLASFGIFDGVFKVNAAPGSLIGPSPSAPFSIHGYGHAGQDWGSGAQMCAYFASGYDFGICTPISSLGSLNTSGPASLLYYVPGAFVCVGSIYIALSSAYLSTTDLAFTTNWPAHFAADDYEIDIACGTVHHLNLLLLKHYSLGSTYFPRQRPAQTHICMWRDSTRNHVLRFWDRSA
jgi:hypothetical protein